MRRAFAAFVIGIVTAAAGVGVAHADSVGNQLSLQRNELRSEYRKVQKDLAAVEEQLEDADEDATLTGSATAVWAVRTTMHERLQKLRSERSELKQRENAIERDYRQLTRKAEDHYEELPMWWGDLD